MSKASIPQGTRDFNAEVVRKRNFIFTSIKTVFELYGYQPLETPAMENLETLMGKYGEEGDKLMFKILNNGLEQPAKHEQARQALEKVLAGRSTKELTERALKYDLTIPFARYVAMHHGQLHFPFKRYQVQPVWRADRPQRGRYREFYQCDADVVGSYSLLNEAELALIYHEVFSRLGISGYTLRINNRKILLALADSCGGADRMTDMTIAIDKLDKIGPEKVQEELAAKGFTASQLAFIAQYLAISGDNATQLRVLQSLMKDNAHAAQGIAEIQYLLDFTAASGAHIVVDLTLARGLNYYTGIIFEAKAPASVKMGSIGGGGRYDDLTGLFGVPGIPGVGISFGVDRIYDVMDELKLFPEDVHTGTRVLFFNAGEAEAKIAFHLMQQLRAAGTRCELYHEKSKFDKQFKYADRKRIPTVVIIGERELADSTCIIKDLDTGVQQTISQDALTRFSFT